MQGIEFTINEAYERSPEHAAMGEALMYYMYTNNVDKISVPTLDKEDYEVFCDKKFKMVAAEDDSFTLEMIGK